MLHCSQDIGENDRNKICEEYRQLVYVDWSKEAFQGQNIPADTEEFWIGVRKHPSFHKLATYALTALVTPVSNATVERVFSHVSAIKTKPRNRMQTEMLDSIVRIRGELSKDKSCCKGFKPSEKMLSMPCNKTAATATTSSATVAANRGEINDEDIHYMLDICSN